MVASHQFPLGVKMHMDAPGAVVFDLARKEHAATGFDALLRRYMTPVQAACAADSGFGPHSRPAFTPVIQKLTTPPLQQQNTLID
eukprot:360679-Chlamydomonas_euryale.AAC.8